MAEAGILSRIDHLEKLLKRIEERKTLFIHSLHDPHIELIVSLPITLDNDGYPFVSYTPDLDIYGCGETEYEAIEDLRQSIVELYFDLKQEKLGEDLQRIFDYLRSVVREK